MQSPRLPPPADPFATALTKVLKDGRVTSKDVVTLEQAAQRTASTDDDAVVQQLRDKKAPSVTLGSSSTTVSLIPDGSDAGGPEYQVPLTVKALTNANVDTYCMQLVSRLVAQCDAVDATGQSDNAKNEAKLAVYTAGGDEIDQAMKRFPDPKSHAHQALDEQSLQFEHLRSQYAGGPDEEPAAPPQ